MNPPAGGLSVLVVEDSAAERWLYSEILRTRGHDVTACADAEAGWSEWQEADFPLVLLDLRLPGMDGLELCRRIRRSEEGTRAIILVVTGRDEPETLEAVLEAGADDYIRKPIDVGLLNVRLAIAEREVARELDRYATDLALDKTSRELTALFNNLDDVFFSFDWRQDRLIQVSPAAAALLGRSPAELHDSPDLVGRTLLPPDARSRLEVRVLSGDTGRTSYTFSIRSPQGVERWIQASYKPVVTEGQISRVDGMLTDITERQQSQVELAARNREIATLARITEIALEAEGADTAFHQILEEVGRATGYPIALVEEWDPDRDVLVARHARGIDLPADGRLEIPCHETLAGEAVHTGRPVVETELRKNPRHRAPALVDLELRAWLSFPLLSGAGARGALSLAHTEPVVPDPRLIRLGLSIASTVATHLERLAAEEALREREQGYRYMALALQRANDELESFAYSVSHDLRVPLRTMQGFAHALLQTQADELSDQSKDFAQRIIASGERAETLISDLLNYSRLSAQELQLQRVQLSQIVDDVLERTQALVEETGAKVERLGECPSVWGHHLTLVQVLVNLVTNAVKFTREGERPHVRIRCVPQAGGAVRVEVEDNGIGVPEEKRDRIFRVFERLADQSHREGTGIGLAIVRRGMERLGGSAGVEEGDDGSRFWILLPNRRSLPPEASI